jgi:flagellar biosynthesis/type III secretory pathway protein FliH
MRSGTYEYQSEFARRYLAQGREEGLQKGLQEGEMRALLEVLEARGLLVDEQARQRIVACTELEQLKRWLRKAVSVQSVQELFESTPT